MSTNRGSLVPAASPGASGSMINRPVPRSGPMSSPRMTAISAKEIAGERQARSRAERLATRLRSEHRATAPLLVDDLVVLFQDRQPPPAPVSGFRRAKHAELVDLVVPVRRGDLARLERVDIVPLPRAARAIGRMAIDEVDLLRAFGR